TAFNVFLKNYRGTGPQEPFQIGCVPPAEGLKQRHDASAGLLQLNEVLFSFLGVGDDTDAVTAEAFVPLEDQWKSCAGNHRPHLPQISNYHRRRNQQPFVMRELDKVPLSTRKHEGRRGTQRRFDQLGHEASPCPMTTDRQYV